MSDNTCILIGAGLDCGKRRRGCSMGPEAYRVAGLPITDADPRWISPADILHMREGDVSSVRVNQPLAYIGHLKFRDELALNTP